MAAPTTRWASLLGSAPQRRCESLDPLHGHEAGNKGGLGGAREAIAQERGNLVLRLIEKDLDSDGHVVDASRFCTRFDAANSRSCSHALNALSVLYSAYRSV